MQAKAPSCWNAGGKYHLQDAKKAVKEAQGKSGSHGKVLLEG